MNSIDWSLMETSSDKKLARLEEVRRNLEMSVDLMIDKQAQALGYRNADSIGKYIGHDNTYRMECEKLGSWVAACYDKCYELLAVGEEMTEEELLSKMPKLDLSV